MKKLKIVQIGAQHDHAAVTINSLKRLKDIFEIVGYAVPDGEYIADPEAYKNINLLSVYEALNTPDLDAVIIETSEKNLTKYTLMAAQKGLAVHMDKPGGIKLSDFERLIETVKNNNTVLHLGYMYRYNPAIIKLMSDIENGKLGEIYSIEAQMSCMHTPEKRQWLESFKGGQLFFLGCHLIDLIYRILGEPIEVIPLNSSTGIDGVTAVDYGMVVLKYKNGISFAKSCAVEPAGFLRRQLVVCGSKGTVELKPFEAYAPNNMQFTGVRECFDDIYNWNNNGENYNTALYNRYDKMMYSFAEYVNGEKINPFSYDYEFNLYKLILKCCGIEEK